MSGAGESQLKSILRQRNLRSYDEFRRAFDQAARKIDRNASGHVPARGTYDNWLSGRAPLPRDGFRSQVLKAMFPGQIAEQQSAAQPVQQPRRTEARPGSPQDLGALLREVRTGAQVSQGLLAQECALDRTVVAKAEAGQRMPTRRFWAEADIALAADGALVQAYDRWAEPQNAPRPGIRVLAQRQAETRQDAAPRSAQPAPDSRLREMVAWSDSHAPLKEREIHGGVTELATPVTNPTDRRRTR